MLLPLENAGALIEAQREADAGKSQWAFDEPQRVASETFALLNVNPQILSHMKQLRESQGRKIYEIRGTSERQAFMMVMSRPYWLSFYAKNNRRVAWVAIAAYESSCGKPNSVTRIR